MKVVRFNIAKPIDLTWPQFGKTLRDIQYATAKALNHCMTEWYLWQREKEDLKEANGKYPTLKEFPGPTNRLYAELRGKYPELSSRMLTAVVNKSKQRWQTDAKDVFYRQDKSLPTFRKTHPVILDRQVYKLEKIEGTGYVLTGTLKSSNAPKEERRVSFILDTKKTKGSQMSILKHILSGDYRNGEATIGWNDRKRKWFLNITYEPPKHEVTLDPDRIVGVDFGINNAFFCAVSDGPKRLSADGWEIEDFRRRIRKRRISIQRQGKFSGRKGKGREKILDPILKLGEKERRFRDSRYHHFSKAIVQFAVAERAGTIQLEDLTSLKADKQEKFVLRDWALADLQTKLKYKAEEYGVKIVEVDPQYTSQRCSSCGHIDKGNRDGVNFLCKQCGTKENADYNAAKNLSIEGIDKIIQKELANLKQTENA
jgi:IS605 OrfB family transposase